MYCFVGVYNTNITNASSETFSERKNAYNNKLYMQINVAIIQREDTNVEILRLQGLSDAAATTSLAKMTWKREKVVVKFR